MHRCQILSQALFHFLFAGNYDSPNRADLDSYIQDVKTEEGNFHACTECGKTSKTRSDLKKHVLSRHIQSPPVPCPYCARTYKNQPSLQAHISQSHREGGRNHHNSEK